MILTPAQQDALVEIVNVGGGKAARHLSVLLRDTVQMNVPEVCVGQRQELPALLGTAPGDLLVGVRQEAVGMLTAQVSLLFHSEESQVLARELVGSGLPMVGADTRALEHDAMTEIGNIVVSAYVGAFADPLGGNIRLPLAAYTEGDLNAILRQVPVDEPEQESFVLLLKTHIRVMRREVEGSLIVIISRQPGCAHPPHRPMAGRHSVRVGSMQAPLSARLWGDMVDQLPLGVLLLDAAGRIQGWNDWLARHTAIAPPAALGRTLPELFPGFEHPRFAWALAEVFATGSPQLLSHTLNRSVIPIRLGSSNPYGLELMQQKVQIAALAAEDSTLLALVSITDVTENVLQALALAEAARELQESSNRDTLTGLYNRRFMATWLAQELKLAQRHNYPIACLMLDIDHFKRINDTHGHAVGDLVLKDFARVLSGQLRDSDLFVRHGGEDFVVLLTRCPLPEALVRAQTLVDALRASAVGTLPAGAVSLKGSAGSYGLAIITDICHQMEDLLSACPANATRLASGQVDGCLAHIDLMRRAQAEAAAGADTFAELERQLAALHGTRPGARLTGLLVETSKVNILLYLNALRSLPIDFTVADNGYVALGQVLQQDFDLLISGQSLPVLNGTALIAAVRLSGMDKRRIPAILVAAEPPEPLPVALATDQVLTRDADIGDALLHSVRELLRARRQGNP